MIIKTCRYCKKEFRARHNGMQLCSNTCKFAERIDRKTFICEECGNKFQRPRHKWEEARFCSVACTAKNNFRKTPPTYEHLIGNSHASGHEPANKGKPSPFRGKRIVEYVSEKCAYCKNEIERPPHVAKRKKGILAFCSVACRSKYRRKYESGTSSPFWVGGPTTYRGRGWIESRAKAVERDNGTCAACGKFIGNSIPVHHITPFRMFNSPQKANQLDNLECLCQSCHMKRENSKADTPEQAF